MGGGMKYAPVSRASFGPTVQLEAGRHEYARADVAVAFWAIRFGFRWHVTSRISIALGLKRQAVGGATYLEQPSGFVRTVPDDSIKAVQALLGLRLR